ncbi:MAG: hypothetical protein HOE90_02025 [Bacteriovoracaceae bacterium]|jgi:tRNA pseudouridine65 synthase|nr:hypothetical protein [Bacteriovoracaceae bacterium]
MCNIIEMPDSGPPNGFTKDQILFENSDLIAVNKPSGLLVHPYWSETNETECLMKQLRDHLGHWVYVIGRLDRPVSGIVLFGKNKESVRVIKDLWHLPSTRKSYLLLVKGIIDEPGVFELPLTDDNKVKKEAETEYWPLEKFEKATLVKAQILTGRKHQIRRHFSTGMHQIIGDTKYGKGRYNQYYRDHFDLHRIFLHAHSLRIDDASGLKLLDVECSLPQELESTLNRLQSDPDLLR